FATSVLVFTVVQRQLIFQSTIDSLLITFDDFGDDYTKALNVSVLNQQPLVYDQPPSQTATIPRIIHQIWMLDGDDEEIPEIWQGARDLCQHHNPNYTINLWDRTAARIFIQQEFGWFLPTYDGYTYSIQRIDALKYFLLWRYGGVYIDLDVSCRRPLDGLLDFPAWFPRTQPMGVSNDVMAASPGHPFMRLLVESLESHNRFYLSKYITVFWSTGPMFVNNILGTWFRAGMANTYISNDATLTAGNWYNGSGCKVKRRFCHLTDIAVLPSMFYSDSNYQFFGHRPGGSWHGKDVAFVAWIYK
ncbi:nucleotide-diphospho-sugar transferase, partial [Talaromyces proteolyticus]